MSTLIRSDIYRLRRGTALRNTIIVLLAILAVFAVTFVAVSSESFADFVESGAIEQFDEGEAVGLQQDFSEAQGVIPASGAEFANMMVGENVLLFFFIPIILTIFCADFTNGTYRNTLSFESSRTKIYLAKLGLSAVICFLMQILMILACWVIGGVAFGSLGFSAGYLIHMAVAVLLFLPGQLAAVCLIHCIIAFTKKSSSTIGIFIGACVGVTMVVQLLSMIPQFDWVVYLDWNSVGQTLINYGSTPLYGLVISVGSGLLVAAASTIAGVAHYRKADLTL